MSILYTAASSESWRSAFSAIPSLPVSYSAWVYLSQLLSQRGDEMCIAVHNNSNPSFLDWLNVRLQDGGDTLETSIRDSVGFTAVNTTNTVSANTWQHCAGYFTASTLKAILNGNFAQSGELANPRSPNFNDVTQFVIGRNERGGDDFMDGRIADVAYWNVQLEQHEFEALARGTHPLNIRPTNLLIFQPLWSETHIYDVVTGAEMAQRFGGVTAQHSPVAYPNRSQTAGLPAGLGATATIGGTVVPNALDTSIVSGGQTIEITLSGDTWVAAGPTFDAQRQAIINGLNSDGVELTGWNNEVRDKEVVTAVVRTSDTLVTITLSPSASYAITADETITVTVPASALVTSVAPIVGAPTFDVLTTAAPSAIPIGLFQQVVR